MRPGCAGAGLSGAREEGETRHFAAVAALIAGLAVPGAGALAQASLGAADFRGTTTGSLARVCAPAATDPARDLATGFCHGQFTAVGQLHAQLTAADGPFTQFYCLPQPTPNVSDTVARFVAWANVNPGRANESAVDGILRFASETFPCPRQTNRGQRRSGR